MAIAEVRERFNQLVDLLIDMLECPRVTESEQHNVIEKLRKIKLED